MPAIRVTSARFEPITVPNAIALFLCIADIIPTINSGMDVENAMIIKETTNSSIRKNEAKRESVRTAKEPAKIRTRQADKKRRNVMSIISFPFLVHHDAYICSYGGGNYHD